MGVGESKAKKLKKRCDLEDTNTENYFEYDFRITGKGRKTNKQHP